MKNLTILLLLFGATQLLSQDWNVLEIGQCPTPGSYDLVLADGQNDGSQRIYVTTIDGGVYEWSYQNDNWTMTNTVHPGPINNLMHIAAGNGRNDGTNRIYFAEWDPSARVFEATWDGANWQIQQIGPAPDINTGIVVGDGRNDGINRLYISGSYGLQEWEWTSSSWNITPLNSNYHEVSGDIGQARNDGTNRIFMNSNCPRELSWNGSSFAQNDVLCPLDTWPDAVQIADGRNDGTQRVYVNITDNPGGRWEYSWNGSGWDSQLIEATSHRGDIHLAKLKSDGANRVYTTTSDYFVGPADDLFEYEWNGSDWVQTGTVLDAVSGATAMLASGNGRNDDTIRMYTPNYVTGGIYEITHILPFVLEPTPTSEIFPLNLRVQLFPNPWREGNLQLTIDSEKQWTGATASLLNALGQRVLQQRIDIEKGTTTHQMICNNCSPGIYFLHISDGFQELFSEKIIRLE